MSISDKISSEIRKQFKTDRVLFKCTVQMVRGVPLITIEEFIVPHRMVKLFRAARSRSMAQFLYYGTADEVERDLAGMTLDEIKRVKIKDVREAVEYLDGGVFVAGNGEPIPFERLNENADHLVTFIPREVMVAEEL